MSLQQRIHFYKISRAPKTTAEVLAEGHAKVGALFLMKTIGTVKVQIKPSQVYWLEQKTAYLKPHYLRRINTALTLK